jgi:hypothetical protein
VNYKKYQTMFEPEMNFLWNESESGWEMPVVHENPASAYFAPGANASKTAANRVSIQKTGIAVTNIFNELRKTVDIAAINRYFSDHNASEAGNQYKISTAGEADAVLTEAIHQFQLSNYINPAEHDGLLGQSTLETLGFYDHGIKSQLNSNGFYGQTVLNANSSKVNSESGGEFTAANWFRYIVRPSFAGIRIRDGVHLMLLRKLREAENWLLSQTQYKGMTRAELGRALGFTKDSGFSAARLSADNQAMHSFGLAIDIHVPGNPWIGAGWIKSDKELLKERYRMMDAFRNAAGNSTLQGSTVFEYLDSISRSSGNDTAAAYSTLKLRNDEFIGYIRSHPSELNYWRSSQTFGGRNPLNGFLNLHPDLVYALRQIAGLAWGAIDFGPNASGDIMHFDLRTLGLGKTICTVIRGYIPKAGHHPAVENELNLNEQVNFPEYELHEAIEEGEDSGNSLNLHPEENYYDSGYPSSFSE